MKDKMTLEEFIEFLNKKRVNSKITKDTFIPLGIYCMEGEWGYSYISVEAAYEVFLDSFTERDGWTTIDDYVASGYDEILF